MSVNNIHSFEPVPVGVSPLERVENHAEWCRQRCLYPKTLDRLNNIVFSAREKYST